MTVWCERRGAALRLPFRRLSLCNISPDGHQLKRHGPAHQLLPGVQDLQAVDELIGVSAARNPENLLRGQPLDLLENRIGDLRPAVGETFVRVLSRVLHHLLPGPREDLSLRVRGDKQGREQHEKRDPGRARLMPHRWACRGQNWKA